MSAKRQRRASPGGRTARRLMLTVATGGVLAGLYLLYALAVNPLIEPPRLLSGTQRVPIDTHVPRPAIYREMAERYLASQPWLAEDDCYTLRTDRAIVYFQEWEEVDDRTAIRFQPFAMIWMQDGREEDEPPITIASKSAFVKFESQFEIQNPNPGRVIGGSLEGDVLITGPDGLKVEGRNFHFNEDAMRIHSDHPLAFAHGPHRGTAHGLQVDLIPDEVAKQQGKLAVKGFRNVRLQRDVLMDLQFEPRSDGESRSAQVRSAGSFEFDVTAHRATFLDRVRVVQPTKPGMHDALFCDQLTLHFEPEPETETGEAVDQEDRFQGIEGNLAFRRLEAEGRDVVLVSQENELQAHMQHLAYDQQEKVAVMRGEPAVRALQLRSEMQSPQITLVHDDEGEITSATCHGAGRLKRVSPETGELEFTAQWTRQLRQYPDPRTLSTVIELEGQAVIRQPNEQTGLSAEWIRLWAERDETAEGTPGGSGQFRPQKLLARTDVTMVTPQMLARTQRLEVWFERLAADSELTPAPAIGRRSRDSLRPALHRVPDDGTAAQPSVVATRQQITSPGANPSGGLTSDEPIEVRADLIQARVLQGEGRDPQVAEILTTGHVHVEQKHLTGEPPLQMEGDKLHIENRSEHDQFAKVWGEPAHIRDRGMHIEGRHIRMDRGANTAVVDGAGLLQLPVSRTLEGEQLDRPKLLDVTWTENMDFDGLTAKFFGTVRATLDESSMRCEEMHVTLNRRISFTEDEPAGGDTDVQIVKCIDNVEFDSTVYEQRKLTELRRGRFAEFSLNQVTGETLARGPGWLRVWRRGRGTRAALAPTATVRANKPLTSDVSDWEFMRIDFSNESRGNLKQRYTEFDDHVTIIYGPVDRPLGELDFNLAELPENAGRMRCERLEITQHPATGLQKAYISLKAQGNSELEGRSFQARADQVTYDESKGLYVLRSFGNREATIWRQQQVGGKVSYTHAQSFWFWPAENRLKADQATGLSGID